MDASRPLLVAVVVALGAAPPAQAAGTVSVTGPAEVAAGATFVVNVSATTDQPAFVNVFNEQGGAPCAATPSEQSARPSSYRVGSEFVFPPGGARDVEITPTAVGPNTVCVYLSSGDETLPPDAAASHSYNARAPTASLRLAAPSRVEISSRESFPVTASGDTESPVVLNVLAQRGGGSCAPTSAEQESRAGTSYVLNDFLGPGPFSRTEEAFLSSGTWVLCGYLYSDRAGAPYATASVPLTVVGGEVVEEPGEEGDLPRGRPSYGSAFGSPPIPLSVGRGGVAANGPSGGGALSGDNRKTRLAAFHSDASNLVRGDSNKTTDVFVWQRPRRRSQIYLSRPAGTLRRASVGRGGRQANGPSTSPSLDGSLTRRPRCVAFQSRASNLAAGDRDRRSDVFVRDLSARKTYLVSRGIRPAATSPSIDGACSRVAFAAGGQVRVAPVRGGRVRSMGRGSQPDFSLDGSALVWVRGGNVWIDRLGRRSRVGPGGKPRVSDNESGIWGIVFNTRRRLTGKDRNSSQDVYTRVVKRSGGPSRTDLISAPGKGSRSFGEPAFNGGITAYGANRGIITFTAGQDAGATLFYRNNNTGNIDNLADTFAGGASSIYDVATSARANFVVWSSRQRLSSYDRFGGTDVYFKHLIDGEPY